MRWAVDAAARALLSRHARCLLLPPSSPHPAALHLPCMQLLEYVTSEFKQIKRKQAQLLGLRQHDGLAGGGTEEERREANRLDPAPPRPPRAKL